MNGFNIIILVIIIALLIVVICLSIELKKSKRQVNKATKDPHNTVTNVNFLSDWLKINQMGEMIIPYLLENNITNVAIYGYGIIGKCLYNELRKSNAIKVECIIDKKNK